MFFFIRISYNKREMELYNFKNIGETNNFVKSYKNDIYDNKLFGAFSSTEYDNLLINKDIDNYFNNIISKPIPQTDPFMIKSNYNLNKFYSDYIEHNLIFIVVLIGIIIFLIIRYYIKDFDTFNAHEKNTDINKIKKQYQKQNEKIKNKSKKIEIDKNKLINYKMELDKEKQQILTIIDELSSINEYENMNQNMNQNNLTNQQNNLAYLNQDINTLYSNNYLDNQSKYYNKINNIHTQAHNDNGDNIIYENDNISNYYDINKTKDIQTNEIEGLYIEPPFM